MSGFGIRENFEAGQHLSDAKLWREESFLHQLSANGSLLLAENHDELYLKLIGARLSLMPGTPWSIVRTILRQMTASEARRILYGASLEWWLAMSRARLEVLRRAAAIGRMEEMLGRAELRALDDRMDLRERQLARLAWCATDTGDEVPIAVIEAGPRRALGPAAQDTGRALPRAKNAKKPKGKR